MREQIQIRATVCNGKPVIAGTRIPVSVILDHLSEGSSVDEVVTKYPELAGDQVLAAIRYCHDVIERTELEPA